MHHDVIAPNYGIISVILCICHALVFGLIVFAALIVGFFSLR